MTSNVKIYRSTDPGAAAYTIYGNVPGSTGGAGGLIGVLRACLVNGYGSKTASSVTVSSGVATFTSTAHGFIVGQCLLLAGATVPSTVINGERYVIATSENTFTFATTHGDGGVTTTGTITAKVAPAGWTEPYTPSTTNISCFKQGGGNGFYFNIDETAAPQSRVVGFESMTACNVANGTAAFPTNVQFPGGVYWNRSDASSTATRAWIIIATDKVLYFYRIIVSDINNADGYTMDSFLDLVTTYHPGDYFATSITGAIGASRTQNYFTYINVPGSTSGGHFLSRPFTQTGSSVPASKGLVDGFHGMAAAMGAFTAHAYPSPTSSTLWTSKVRVFDVLPTSVYPRGLMPGLLSPLHDRPFTNLDTFTGSGDLAGKTFIALSGNPAAQFLIETSNTWDI